MNPLLGTILFGGAGYLLVYASTANHGRFATHPWAGVVADAYTTPASSGAGKGGGGGAGPDIPPAPGSSGTSKAPAAVSHGRSTLGEVEHVAGQVLGGLLGGIPFP